MDVIVIEARQHIFNIFANISSSDFKLSYSLRRAVIHDSFHHKTVSSSLQGHYSIHLYCRLLGGDHIVFEILKEL
jgi:hypothetical protein